MLDEINLEILPKATQTAVHQDLRHGLRLFPRIPVGADALLKRRCVDHCLMPKFHAVFQSAKLECVGLKKNSSAGRN